MSDCNFKSCDYKSDVILVPATVVSTLLAAASISLCDYGRHDRSLGVFGRLTFPYERRGGDEDTSDVCVRSEGQYGCMGAAISAATSPRYTADCRRPSCSVRM